MSCGNQSTLPLPLEPSFHTRFIYLFIFKHPFACSPVANTGCLTDSGYRSYQKRNEKRFFCVPVSLGSCCAQLICVGRYRSPFCSIICKVVVIGL